MSAPGGFLDRWSRLKREGEAAPAAPAPAQPPSAAAPVSAVAPASDADAVLPPLETLDFDADFTGFLRKEVSESLRRAALRKLFSDPHFDRIDPLDIYIDDYTVGEPIPPELMKRLRQFEVYLKDDAEAPEPPEPPEPPGAAAPGEAQKPADVTDELRHSGADETNCVEPAADSPKDAEK